MRTRPPFDPFRQHPFGPFLRILFISVAALLVFATPSVEVDVVTGTSGDVYPVFEQARVWRAVGPVFSVRFSTKHVSRSSVASEAADLFPYFASRADSAQLRYLLIRATRPVARLGSRFGLYRSWNFRYERGEDGWVPSGYW